MGVTSPVHRREKETYLGMDTLASQWAEAKTALLGRWAQPLLGNGPLLLGELKLRSSPNLLMVISDHTLGRPESYFRRMLLLGAVCEYLFGFVRTQRRRYVS